jgi:phosphate transport system ATP-binding protein
LLNSAESEAPAIATITAPVKIRISDLNVYYGDNHAIKNVTLDIAERQVTALMGPSGCGKSTFIRALNRMHDLTPTARVRGTIWLDGEDIYAPGTDVVHLRQRVGMVFQRPNPFPKSIFENVAYGLQVQGGFKSNEMKEIVERSLRSAAL